MSCFGNGDYQDFFKLWVANIPTDTLNEDVECQKLEFHLRLHFAIFPLVKNMGKMVSSFRTISLPVCRQVLHVEIFS